MIIDRQQDGLFFEIEQIDFKGGNWKKLLDCVKAFRRWEYDSDAKRWWICEEHVKEFFRLKKQLIDNKLNPNQISLFKEENEQ